MVVVIVVCGLWHQTHATLFVGKAKSGQNILCIKIKSLLGNPKFFSLVSVTRYSGLTIESSEVLFPKSSFNSTQTSLSLEIDLIYY